MEMEKGNVEIKFYFSLNSKYVAKSLTLLNDECSFNQTTTKNVALQNRSHFWMMNVILTRQQQNKLHFVKV